MRTKTTKLSRRELSILQLLANGKTCRQIQEYFDPCISEANVHTCCYNIRQKTGIKETRDPRECRAYVRTFLHNEVARAREVGMPKPPTERQVMVLRLLVQGRNYRQIGQTMGLGYQSAQNAACRAAKRVGIEGAGWQRTQLIREWISQYDASNRKPVNPMDDPMF